MAKLAESVKVVIHPSGADADSLTVADAMQQVLDTFALLSKAETKDPTRDVKVVWRLESASTNSPFTVEATPLSSHSEIPVERQAILAMTNFREGIDAVLHAKAKPAWMDAAAEETFKRLLGRNLNGVGRTDIFFPNESLPTTIDHRSARRAENFLEMVAAKEALKVVDLTRKEYGSVEGNVTDATTYYGRPAFRIRLRLSGKEVICVLPLESRDTVGKEHDWSEVFANQRVLVSGVCHYNAAGAPTRVDVEKIRKIVSRDVSLKDLNDPGITNGRDVDDHLRLIWGDEING